MCIPKTCALSPPQRNSNELGLCGRGPIRLSVYRKKKSENKLQVKIKPLFISR